jgi:hypothetical protein
MFSVLQLIILLLVNSFRSLTGRISTTLAKWRTRALPVRLLSSADSVIHNADSIDTSYDKVQKTVSSSSPPALRRPGLPLPDPLYIPSKMVPGDLDCNTMGKSVLLTPLGSGALTLPSS